MNYRLNIFEGLDGLRFGAPVGDTRSYFSEKFESYVMGESLDILKDDFPTDYYREIGVFCYFNKSGNLEAIEFLSPSRPIMNEVDLLSLSVKEAIHLFIGTDPELDINATRAISKKLSIGFVFSYEDDSEDARIASFLLGCPGYYDDI